MHHNQIYTTEGIKPIEIIRRLSALQWAATFSEAQFQRHFHWHKKFVQDEKLWKTNPTNDYQGQVLQKKPFMLFITLLIEIGA